MSEISTTNVVTLFKGVADVPKPSAEAFDATAPLARLVEMLEEKLEHAKSGKLRGFIFAGIYPEEKMAVTAVSGSDVSKHQLVASSVYLQTMLLNG